MKAFIAHWCLLIVASVFFVVPQTANAFSFDTLIERHQERMQRQYEYLSDRLCAKFRALIPFADSSEWCSGFNEGGEKK